MTDTGSGSSDGSSTGAADRRLDGNAAAGALRELFAVDLTAAVCTCAHCGGTAPLGAHVLYADAPALVLRCPGCTAVVLRFSAVGGWARLDMAGTRLLEVDVGGGAGPGAARPHAAASGAAEPGAEPGSVPSAG